MPNTSAEHVTLAVLAGGAGSRMGVPKARLTLRGQPILEHLLDRIAWPGPTLLVTTPGREGPAGAGRFGREVSDAVSGEGPLRGVLTALQEVETEAAVFIAVDMPAVTRGVLEWYAAQMAARPAALGVMGRRGGEVEPLPCALRPEAMDLVAARLSAGRRALHGLGEDPAVAVVDASGLPPRAWLNLNTPGEWEQFLRDGGGRV